MARLFSIQFDFLRKQYTVLVSLRKEGHDLSCQVRYTDKELQRILPGDSLVFNLAEGLKQPKQLSDDLAVQLVNRTTDAISAYLNTER
ncbi:MAG TPA: hypothetical protein VHK69_16095 [Chitinophagaceae bacterium]|jgi:hypothetical protein|nr:hypothetical protein [Chitinophagaceae bacterium]